MSTYLLLDCHYLCHRAHWAMRDLSHNGSRTGALFGFFRDLIIFRDLFGTDKFIFCFDHGRTRRQEICSTYKSNRRADLSEEQLEEHNDVQRQIVDLRTKYLERIGFRNVFSQQGYEADDIIASVCLESIPEDDDAVIISSDNDLLQLLSSRVVLYNPHKKKVTNSKSFKLRWGVDPVQWAEVKAIAGCATDAIAGIPGIGEVTAAQWVAGTLKRSSKRFETIDSNLGIVNNNRILTKLPFPGTGVYKFQADEIDLDEWKLIGEELGMSTLREFRSFIS